jgi:hypothetical protein
MEGLLAGACTKMDSRFRGNDGVIGMSAVTLIRCVIPVKAGIHLWGSRR